MTTTFKLFAGLATIGRRGRLWGEKSYLTDRHTHSGDRATDSWISVLRCETWPIHKVRRWSCAFASSHPEEAFTELGITLTTARTSYAR